MNLGQSIDGTISSILKIDASYLSINIDMVNNLEENIKLLKKKDLIMTRYFYDYLSDDAKKI